MPNMLGGHVAQMMGPSAVPLLDESTIDTSPPGADVQKVVGNSAKRNSSPKKKVLKPKAKEQVKTEETAKEESTRRSFVKSEDATKQPKLEEEKIEGWKQIVRDSWEIAKNKGNKQLNFDDDLFSGLDNGYGHASMSVADSSRSRDEKKSSPNAQVLQTQAKTDTPSRFSGWFRRSKSTNNAETESVEKQGAASSGSAQYNLPQTFDDMMTFNCRLMGKNETMIKLVLEKFNDLVNQVVRDQDAYTELEAHLLVLLLHKECKGKVVLKDYEVVLFASMRGLLAIQWDANHEKAWSKMWNLVTEKIETVVGYPAKYEVPTKRFVDSLEAKARSKFGLDVFTELFKKAPESEKYFKQNKERLKLIVNRAVDLSVEIYQDPRRVIVEVQKLSLRHIMYNVDVQHFEPFVECTLQELRKLSKDTDAMDGINWTITQIAVYIIRAINEQSNPLIRAVLSNSPQKVKAALADIPRNHRAAAVL